MQRIGIDLGGTKIEGVLLDENGTILRRKRVPTGQADGYDAVLNRIGGLYDDLRRHAIPRHTLGIGTPGAVSTRTGMLKNSNTLCLNGQLLVQNLEKRLERPLAVENDANCFAMAEAVHGAGRGRRLVFGVIMGTGCGGGIVFDGQVWRGPQAIAGEWGHMSIDPQGPECYCGNRGCVETLISGGGLERMWRGEHGADLPLREIVRAFRAGDPPAAAFMRKFFVNFGRATANLINMLDPDVVIFGGGVSNIDEIYTQGVEQTARFIFSDSLDTPLVRHTLGDSAGVIGAALIGV